GGTQDHIEEIEIDQEILAELVLGVNPACLQEVTQVGQRLPGGGLRDGHVIAEGKGPARRRSPRRAASPATRLGRAGISKRISPTGPFPGSRRHRVVSLPGWCGPACAE